MANTDRESFVVYSKSVNKDVFLRKGKWTTEEENYANMIIDLFNQGMLPIVAGTTLRTYLSDKLRCNPMRITKKYAGESCIGKQVFQPCEEYSRSIEKIQENQIELQKLENIFLLRINAKSSSSGSLDKIESYVSKYEKSNYESSYTDINADESCYSKSDQLTSFSYNAKSSSNNEQRIESDEDYGYYDESTEEYDEYHNSKTNNDFFNQDYNNSNDFDSYETEESHLNDGTNSPKVSSFSSLLGATKRVFSAPNLTQLNISRWKETKYKPLPADSLKEIFYQQQIVDSNQFESITGFHLNENHPNPYDSILPKHVYSAIENESGRLNQHNYKSSIQSGDIKFPIGTHRSKRFTALGGKTDPITGRKRSQSVVTFLELENIATDDAAAGELFMQFLHTINSPVKNTNSTEQSSDNIISGDTKASNNNCNTNIDPNYIPYNDIDSIMKNN